MASASKTVTAIVHGHRKEVPASAVSLVCRYRDGRTTHDQRCYDHDGVKALTDDHEVILCPGRDAKVMQDLGDILESPRLMYVANGPQGEVCWPVEEGV